MKRSWVMGGGEVVKGCGKVLIFFSFDTYGVRTTA